MLLAQIIDRVHDGVPLPALFPGDAAALAASRTDPRTSRQHPGQLPNVRWYAVHPDSQMTTKGATDA